MALRTVTTQMAMPTLANWRDLICSWIGVAYASLDAQAKAEVDRYIDEAHELVSEDMGHYPWAQREWSESLAAGVQTFPLADDVRHVINFEETDGTNTRRVIITTKAEWFAARGDDDGTHPWDLDTTPRYYFDGMDDTDPPLQQWKRHPIPSASLTITVFGRPIFGTLAGEAFTELPATARPRIRAMIRREWALYERDTEAYALESAHYDKLKESAQKNDDLAGAAEVPTWTDMPAEAYSEMEGP